MRIETVPALRDNYAYLVIDERAALAAVVDPSEAAPVRAALERTGVRPVALWCTHHHADHVGGVESLLEVFGPLDVFASAHDLALGRVPRQTHGLSDGDTFELGGTPVEVLHVPGHTLGAVAYRVGDAVFTGDTLFLGGCGRLFEGTAAVMQRSLARLAALPPATRIFCGHEYTEKNLRFGAEVVEPGNARVRERLGRVVAARARGLPSGPATVAEELETNPFLRWDAPEVRATAERLGAGWHVPRDAADVFGILRTAKDAY